MSSNFPITGYYQGQIHHLPLRVYYEDTDFSGLVYHASYLRFMERGRTESLRAAGVAQSDLHADTQSLFFAVRRMTIDFRAPARMDDCLIIETHISEIRGASLMIEQRILRPNSHQNVDHDILVTAQVQIATLSGGRPTRLPASLRTRLKPE